MTSRERIMAALNHKEPDRVPIDFSGPVVRNRSVGVAALVSKSRITTFSVM
jgi:hypothetical protein